MAHAGHAAGSQLAQVLPSSTSAVTLYQNTGEVPVEVTLLTFVLVSGNSADVTLYHDDDGTSYVNGTAIAKSALSTTGNSNTAFGGGGAQSIGAGITVQPGGSLGVEISSANAVNVTAYGVSADLAEPLRPGGTGRIR